MNINIIDTTREIMHGGSVVLLAVILILLVVVLIRPAFVKRWLYDFSQRRYILATGLFAVLLCGTIFTATYSPDSDFQRVYEETGTSQGTEMKLPDVKPEAASPAPAADSGSNSSGSGPSTLGSSSSQGAGTQSRVPASSRSSDDAAKASPGTPAPSSEDNNKCGDKSELGIKKLGLTICL